MTSGDDISAVLKNIEVGINSRLDELQKDFNETKQTLQSQITESSERITQDIANMRGVIINNLVRENRRLQTTVSSLVERVIKVEKQANETEQHNRKCNIEIAGIPAIFVQNRQEDKLKPIAAKILNHLADSDISENDLEAVHRIKSKTSPFPTIVRMKRNLVDEVKTKENKKKLSTVAATLELPEGTKIFINENLSRNMKSLSYNARLLKREGLIADTWFANAAVRIKKIDESVVKVSHEHELYEMFPDFHFSFDTSLYVPETEAEDEEDMNRLTNLDGAWNNLLPPPGPQPAYGNFNLSLNHSGTRPPMASIQTRQMSKALSMSGATGGT